METRFCYRTARYAECRAFYERALGWQVFKEWDRGDADKGVVYHAGTALLEILLSAPDEASRLDGGFYLYLETSELEALRVKLEGASAIQTYPWGHASFRVHDPAGLELKFFQQNF